MRVTIFGATGALGGQCLEQSLAAGHEVTLLARSPGKVPAQLASRARVIEGNALVAEDVERALQGGSDAVLFAIGVDRRSPENLCADATAIIFEAMRRHGVSRFVWCGGGSTLVEEDQVTVGARFVALFAATFMGLRHRDKAQQMHFLRENEDLEWLGLRPLQMKEGERRESYRVGFDRFSGLSSISFADCAHAMVGMLSDDTWLHRAPVIQY
jgi:putative NADH-flavin reductase